MVEIRRSKKRKSGYLVLLARERDFRVSIQVHEDHSIFINLCLRPPGERKLAPQKYIA
jgi:hypothetical protein